MNPCRLLRTLITALERADRTVTRWANVTGPVWEDE